MAHQRPFWDIALEHEEGLPAYPEVGWRIARQCGKTVALLLLMLWRCLRWPGQVVRYGRDRDGRPRDAGRHVVAAPRRAPWKARNTRPWASGRAARPAGTEPR